MATKVAFQIEIGGYQKAAKNLQPIVQEFDKILERVTELNKNLSGDLKASGARLEAIIKQLKEAAKLSAEVRRSSGGSRTSPGSPAAPGGSPAVPGESLTQEYARLLREAKNRAGELSEEYEQIIARVSELKAAQKGVTDEIRRQARAVESEAFEPGSYKAIEAEVGRLADQWRRLSQEQREGLEGRELTRAIARQRQELKDLDAQIGLNFRNVGNYRDAIRGLNGAFAALGALSVAGVGGREILELNAQISDSISDVRKTTGLSAQALEGYNDVVLELEQNLKNLDTRTGLADLLDISRIAGQLGIGKDLIDQFKELSAAGDTVNAQLKLDQARAEIEGFTAAVDQVNVALGDTLGGGADEIARDFGRLAEILDVSGEIGGQDIAASITTLASALNTLGASGQAAEGPMVDFLKRTAPLAQQANLGAAALAGYAATFDEIGLSAEVTGTAFTKFVLKLGEDVDKFAQLAGVSSDEFRTLLEEDANQAIILLLEKLNEQGALVDESGNVIGDGVERLNKLLGELGVEGSARAAQAIGGLAGNLDKLKLRQEQANEEFRIARGEIEGTSSVVEEFNEKNNNLAGTIDKLRRSFTESFTSPEVRDSLQEIGEEAAGLVPIFRDLILLIVQGFIGGIKTLVSFTKIMKELTIIFGLFVVVVLASDKALRKEAAAKIQNALASGKLAKAKAILTRAIQAVNTAFKANPILLVISLVAGLIIWIANLQNRYEGLREKISSAVIQFDAFLKKLGFLTAPLRFTIQAFRILIDLVSNFDVTIGALQETVGVAVNNIQSFFTRLVNRAKIVGLELQQALSFDQARDKALQSQIDALEAANESLKSQELTLAVAYEAAYAKAELRAMQAKKEQEEVEARKVKLEQEAGGGTITGGDPSGDGTNDGKSYGKSRADAEAEERKKAQEEAERDRLDAERRILKLQTQLIKDELQRRIAELNLENKEAMRDLVGDPEQIKEQAALLGEQLIGSYREVFDERAEFLAEKANESIDSIEGPGGLLPTVEDIQAQGIRISTALQDELDALLAIQEEKLREQGVAEERIQEELRVSRETFAQVREDQERENQAKLLQFKLDRISQEEALEKASAERILQQRLLEIERAGEQEGLTRDQIDEQRKEAEATAEEEEIQREIRYWERRLALAEQGSAQYLDIQAKIAEGELKILDDRNKRQQELDTKSLEQRKRVSGEIFNAFQSLLRSGQEALAKDEEARKKNAAKIKALAIGEIVVNLARQIQQILANPFFSALPDGGAIIKGINIAAATTAAGVQIVKVKNQEFRKGGKIGEGDVLSTGTISGPSHSNGGVNVVTPSGQIVTAEGGERVVRNGPETYVINRANSELFSSTIDKLGGSETTFSPFRKVMASEINSFGGSGVSFFRRGGLTAAVGAVINRPGIPEPVLPGLTVPNRSNQEAQRALMEQNRLLSANLQAMTQLATRTPQVNLDSEKMVRAGLKSIQQQGNGISS